MNMTQAAYTRTRQRTLAWIASAVLALSLLLGTAFVLMELHHDCSGEHCAICLAVSHSVAYLKADTASALPVSVSTSFFAAVFLVSSRQKQTLMQKDSPVTMKVKLSD